MTTEIEWWDYDDADEFAHAALNVPRPGGVRCSACGARSRAVAL